MLKISATCLLLYTGWIDVTINILDVAPKFISCNPVLHTICVTKEKLSNLLYASLNFVFPINFIFAWPYENRQSNFWGTSYIVNKQTSQMTKPVFSY